MARDIKYNLRSQSDKLENKTLKNLYGMQGDLTKSNRLVTLIKKARFKNKLILWGIIALLVISVIFVFWMALAPSSSTSETTVVEQSPMALEGQEIGYDNQLDLTRGNGDDD